MNFQFYASLNRCKPIWIEQLYDRISCTVMSPSRAPPGDAVSRCRDTIEAILTAPGHKYGRERNELAQLLSLPHIQVRKFVILVFNI